MAEEVVGPEGHGEVTAGADEVLGVAEVGEVAAEAQQTPMRVRMEASQVVTRTTPCSVMPLTPKMLKNATNMIRRSWG